MLRCLSGLISYRINAVDGEIGKVKDFFFDDADWTVRYFVVDAGSWLNRNRVLISPALVHEPEWEGRRLPVILTVEQVKSSPDVDTDKPVSRRHENCHCRGRRAGALLDDGRAAFLRDRSCSPAVPRHGGSRGNAPAQREPRDGYRLHAIDGEFGTVYDFIVDDEQWSVRYVVVATGDWLPGKKVLIAPKWIEYVSWEAKEVAVSLSREEVRDSPEYDPLSAVNREYELRLYDYYGRPRYWA
jgi:hypothetical protein